MSEHDDRHTGLTQYDALDDPDRSATGLTQHGEDAAPPGRLEARLMAMGTLGELMAVLVRNGRWWLLPLVGVLVLAGLVALVLQAVEVVLPFVYI